MFSKNEIFGAIVAMLGYIVLIISANQDIANIIQGESGSETPGTSLLAPITAAISIIIIAISNIILARIATARLRERAAELQAESTATSIMPNINITLGSIISAIGHSLESVGTVQRASEPTARITIV